MEINIDILSYIFISGGHWPIRQYGVNDYDYDEANQYHNDDILEYRYEDGWRKVRRMKNRRSYHALSLVNYDDFKEYCN